MGTHPHAHDRDLADLVVIANLGEADTVFGGVQRLDRLRAIAHRQSEGDIGGAGGDRRYVLHDHVDVDVLVGDDVENGRGHARLVRNPHHRDLRLAAVVGDSADDGFFHGVAFLETDPAGDQCAGIVAE